MNPILIEKKSTALSFIAKYKYVLYFAVFVSVIYVFPILLANVYYIDDMGRAVSGKGWNYDGRPLASFIMTKMTGGARISDFFPYSIIFSAIVVSLAGYIVSYVLDIEKNSKYKLSAFVLLINPFFLENLSYRWDSIPMAVSVFSVIFPFLFISSRYLFVLLSVVGICMTMLTYQASISIYPIIVLSVMASYCFKDKTDKNILIFLLTSVIAFFLGLVVYKIIDLISPVHTGGRGEIILFEVDFLSLLQTNVLNAIGFVKLAFSRYFTLIMVGSLGICIIAYLKFLFSNKSVFKKISIPIICLLILFFIVFILLFLRNPVYVPRVLVGFSFLSYTILIFANYLSGKLASFISLLFILISFPLVASYANALKAQNNHEIFTAQKIAQTVDVNDKRLAFFGQLEHTEETHVAFQKFPILTLLVPSYMNSGWTWGPIMFVKANNYMYLPILLNAEEYPEFISHRNEIPIIDGTRYYVLRADSSRVVVDFTKSR